MYPNTSAYLRYKEQSHATLHFALIVCYSVPSLKAQIRAFEAGVTKAMPKPDFFIHDVSSTDRLRHLASTYKKDLASFLLISHFSFFEAYVIDAIKEMISFHGGADNFIRHTETRDKRFMSSVSSSVLKDKRALQDSPRPSKVEKYKKHSKLLTNAGYRFPSELLSAYGVRMLVQKINSLRANGIPELLTDGLHMSMSGTQIQRFHAIRDKRNEIAHGTSVNLSIGDVKRMNNDLDELAVALDQHLVEHYFVIEKYVP